MGELKLKQNMDAVELPQNVETVLQSLGGFGRFQAILLFLLLCCEIPMSIMLLFPVFIGAPPDTWQCGNETISKGKACECQQDLLPVDSSSSIVSEWNLVCKSAWVLDTIFTGRWVGILIGNIFASQLSDKYGRRRPFLILGIIMACGTIATATSVNLYIYVIARFLSGVGYVASIISLQGLWFTRALTYFGITNNINNQTADPYLTLVYMGIVGTVAEMSSLLFANRLGRRRSFFLTMTITAIFLVVIAIMEFFVDFEKHGVLLMILCLCARFGTSAARSIARTLTAELFPTEIRTKASGLAKVPGSIAGGLATQIVLLGSYWPSVPFFILAVAGTVGSLLAFLLEEPAGKQLEETISSGDSASKNPT